MRYNDLFVTGMENCWKSDFLKKNFAGINFRGLVKSKHFISRVQIFAILCENRKNREN